MLLVVFVTSNVGWWFYITVICLIVLDSSDPCGILKEIFRDLKNIQDSKINMGPTFFCASKKIFKWFVLSWQGWGLLLRQPPLR